MRKLLLACLLALACPGLACADNDKIDPATYVCAELVSEPGIMKGDGDENYLYLVMPVRI